MQELTFTQDGQMKKNRRTCIQAQKCKGIRDNYRSIPTIRNTSYLTTLQLNIHINILLL